MEKPAVIDMDNHYYEPNDCFTRHMDPSMASRGPHWRKNEDGVDKLWVGDRRFTFLSNIGSGQIPVPGSLSDLLRKGTHRAQSGTALISAEPAFVSDRTARLALLDEQGLNAALLLPTLGITIEEFLFDDVDATYATLRAFNDWQNDDWGFSYKNRLFTAPLMSLLDVEQAVQELNRVLELGARVIHLRQDHRVVDHQPTRCSTHFGR